jgi:hypothetical protein
MFGKMFGKVFGIRPIKHKQKNTEITPPVNSNTTQQYDNITAIVYRRA